MSERHSVQRDVEAFHRALDIPCGNSPAIRRPELRASLIEEEAAETCAAIRAGDLIEAIDGLCDLLCVTYGAAAEFGIDLAPFWDEVHRTNMAKVGGPVRENGKRLKPEGWQPPDIAGVLAAEVSGGTARPPDTDLLLRELADANRRGSELDRENEQLEARVALLEEALRGTENAGRALTAALITVVGYLSKPYPDRPEWTPWTRFVEPALVRFDDARKVARAALAGVEQARQPDE